MCGGLRKQNRCSELWKYSENEEKLIVIGVKKKETAENLKEDGGGVSSVMQRKPILVVLLYVIMGQYCLKTGKERIAILDRT